MTTKQKRVASILADLPPDCGIMPATELDAEEIEDRERLFPAMCPIPHSEPQQVSEHQNGLREISYR